MIQEEILVDGEQMDIDSQDEFEISAFGQSLEDDIFDNIVGRLEEIVMSHEFNGIHEEFLKKNCFEFTPGEENKLVYMEIFQKYQNEVEKYIGEKLRDVKMDQFFEILMRRQNEIDGPLFEMMLSLSDFQVFKDLMISYNSGEVLEITGKTSVIHNGKN